MMALALVSVAQARLVFNGTFDGGSNDEFYKWDTTRADADFSNNDFRELSGGFPVYARNIEEYSIVDNATIYAKFIADDNSGGNGRFGSIGFSNVTATVTDYVANLRFFAQLDFRNDRIIFFEDAVFLKYCDYDFNKGTVPSPYDFRWKLIGRNSTVYIDNNFGCDALLNYTLTSANSKVLVAQAYVLTPQFRVFMDDIAGEWINPLLESVNTNLVNNTINYNEHNITITYNGTLIDSSDYVFNCSLYVDSQLNQTDSDVDISSDQNFFVDWGDTEKDYDFEVMCENAETDQTTGAFTYSIDTIDPRINIWSPLNITYDKTAGNVTANVTIYDPNLFAWNSTLRNSIGTVVHNFFEDNLNVTNTSTVYDFTSLDLFPDSYTWLWTAWDSHTSPKPVKILTWYFDDNNLIAEDDIVWEGDFLEETGQGDPATYFYLAPEGDKYKLKMTFPDQALSHTINISSPSGNLDFRPDDGWEGHFVYFPAERYIDHEGKNVESVDVTYLGNNKWNLVINHYNATDEVEFESIGDLNRRDKTAGFGVTCAENWVYNLTVCSIYDNQTVQYYDTNACGTTNELPADDSDVLVCNYCTAVWNYAETECQNTFQRITYGSDLLNNATCCQVTGIADDCDAPVNTSVSCAGIHTTGDVTGVVIDFGVGIGLVLLSFVAVFVIWMLVVWVLERVVK